jgi:hypothetical protein
VQGFPDQAVRSSKRFDGARATSHALTLCNVLVHAACPIVLYVGDLAAAERSVATLLEHSAKHALTVWNALGRCLKGTLLLARGDVAGLELLRTALDWLREHRFGLRYAAYLGTFAQGMAAAGQTADARIAIDEALDRCERSGAGACQSAASRRAPSDWMGRLTPSGPPRTISSKLSNGRVGRKRYPGSCVPR